MRGKKVFLLSSCDYMPVMRFIEIREDQEKHYQRLCEKEKLFPYSNSLLDIMFDAYKARPSKERMEYFDLIINKLDVSMTGCNPEKCRTCGFNNTKNETCEYAVILDSLRVLRKSMTYD